MLKLIVLIEGYDMQKKVEKIYLNDERDVFDSYFECITSCYGVEGEDLECVTDCVEIHLKEARRKKSNNPF